MTDYRTMPKLTAEEKVAANVANAIDRPDKPLTWVGIDIPRDVLDKVTPSKMYEDDGVKLAVTSEICARGMTVEFPSSKRMLLNYYNEFVHYCMRYRLPPTLSLFSMWCGTTVNGYNRHMRRNEGTDLGEALEECKESLRAFIEVAAMQGEVDKLIYFHQQKGYYDVVEKVAITHELEIAREEMTEDEIDAVLRALPPIDVAAEAPEGAE